jgi:hypothetical protein
MPSSARLRRLRQPPEKFRRFFVVALGEEQPRQGDVFELGRIVGIVWCAQLAVLCPAVGGPQLTLGDPHSRLPIFSPSLCSILPQGAQAHVLGYPLDLAKRPDCALCVSSCLAHAGESYVTWNHAVGSILIHSF